MASSYVVTGGGHGIGRAIVDRLVASGESTVISVDLSSTEGRRSVVPLVGDVSDEKIADQAVRMAAENGTFRGWVNNAAIFRDAWLHETPAPAIVDLINRNLAPMIVGCGAAVRHFLSEGNGGSIVNISSHQGQRAVRGAFPYATAKAAIEGLTRALAVDYGPFAVRVNALALGSIATERSAAHLAALDDEERAWFGREVARLQPLGRLGAATEVADAVAFLLSGQASFINGAIIPIDGGRSAIGLDPEER